MVRIRGGAPLKRKICVDVKGERAMDEPMNGTDTGERFWVMAPDNETQWVFGSNTIAIVDETQSGIILYCHENNADWIITALREKVGVER